MRIAISLLAVGAVARAAIAAPAEVKVTNAPAALPAGVKPSGDPPTASFTFEDKNGTNYVLFSWRQVYERDPAREQSPPRSRYLWVDHWAVAAGGKPKLLRAVKDHVEACDADVTLAFHDDAFTVTDLDGDGYAEITFAYELGCRSDVSPNDYKLLVLQNGTKYILRGRTSIATRDAQQPAAGGDFTPDPAKRKWPAALYQHAIEVWQRTDYDGTLAPPLGPDDHD
jgi:hypothetical protein